MAEKVAQFPTLGLRICIDRRSKWFESLIGFLKIDAETTEDADGARAFGFFPFDVFELGLVGRE